MIDSSAKKVKQFKEDFRDNPYQKQRKHFDLEQLLDRDPVQLDTINIKNFVRNKRIMITGAAGSIGRHLSKQLTLFKPNRLLLIDSSETGIYELDEELKNIYEDIEIITIPANITDPRRMKHIFQHYQPQIVFHAAANKHVPIMEKNPYEAIKTNILGTKILADLSNEYWVEKFVFISTDKAVNPTGIMGASKRCSEMYLQSLAAETGITTQYVITRFGNVLGSSGSVIPRFVKQIDRGGPVEITHPDVMRYFITMQEACQLVLEAGAIGQSGEVFILEMGDRILLKDLAQKMIRLSGFRVGEDIGIIYIGLRPGEKLLEERLNKHEKINPSQSSSITITNGHSVNSRFMADTIRQLEKALDSGEDNEMVLILKNAIPEYISHNSEFEKLDLLSGKTNPI